MNKDIATTTGQCHCGGVKFTVSLLDGLRKVVRCNCTMCRMKGAVMAFASMGSIEVTEGEALLSTYQFHTNVAKHHFCSVCGIKSFYVPRSKPDGFSVNVRCLDDGAAHVTRITLFDGEHWEEAMAKLAEAGA